MNNPFFSVIIPTYNASKFIENTLESVRNQNFSDYEIIVINDGSTDNTLELLKNYFYKHSGLNHQIIDQKNKGIGGARNVGIKAARGEFIAFLDADDLWFPSKLEKVKQYIDTSYDADLICHDEYWVTEGKNKIKVRYGPYKTYDDLLLKENCISTSAVVVRRLKLFEAGLFSENMDFNGVEDYELWLRLSKISKIKYLHEYLGIYNINSGGITSKIEVHMQNSINVIEYHFKQLKKDSFYYRYLMNKRRAAIFRSSSREFLKVGNKQLAWKTIITALKLNPFSFKTWIVIMLNSIELRI